MAVVLHLDPPTPFFPNSVAFRLRKPNKFDSLGFPLNPNRSSRNSPHLKFRRGRSSITSQRSSSEDEEESSAGVRVALSMLRFYKREISPVLPNSCRYIPTCSEYSMEAYKKYGVVKGTVLTAWRLCRCSPLGGSGFDPPRWFDEEQPSPEE